jgi:hypothetical protein
MAFFQEQPNFRASAPREAIKPGQYRGPLADPRPNRYGGKCRVCGVYVEAGAGNLVGSAGAWGVEHKPGECPTISVDESLTGAPTKAPEATTEFKVPDGRYTIIWGDHHKTIRVRHQGEYDDFKPGQVILSHLTGSNNDSDYTSFAHVDERGEVRIWKKYQGVENLREAVKVLLGDPKAASQAYAQESGCCGVCGRTLTTPESLAAGIGPECAKRVSW